MDITRVSPRRAFDLMILRLVLVILTGISIAMNNTLLAVLFLIWAVITCSLEFQIGKAVQNNEE